MAYSDSYTYAMAPHKRVSDVPAWDSHEQHQIESLRYQLDQQRRETAHFKAVAQDLEKNLASVRDTQKRQFEALNALTRGTGGIVPNYTIQGDFTVCQLGDPVAEQIFVGVAKCAPHDKFDRSIGEAVSFGRAAAQRAEYWAREAFAR